MTLVTWFDFDGTRVVTQFERETEAEIFCEQLDVNGLWRVAPGNDARSDRRYGQETATRDARTLQNEIDVCYSHNMGL
jgi:hypothetical protein